MTIFLTCLIVFFAYLGEAVFGFGAGLISLPLLLEFYSVKTSVTLLLCYQVFTALLLFKSRKHLDFSVLKPALLATVIGVLAGLYFLSILNESQLKLTLAIVIVAYLFKELLSKGKKKNKSNITLISSIGGFAGGFLQGSFGLGGPGFLIYLNELGLKKYTFRVSILALFLICNVFRYGISYQQGLFTPEVINLFFYTTPAVILGLLVGYRLHFSVSEKLYKVVIYLILGLSATQMIIKEVF